MAITKEMLKRCQNELKQAFCAMDEDVQEVIKGTILKLREHRHILDPYGRWKADDTLSWQDNHVYRLSPDTPTEPEWIERGVKVQHGDGCFGLYGIDGFQGETWRFVSVAQCVVHPRFIGIIYQKYGIETLRTSVDAAFGTPVRVRFSKP